MNVDGSGEYPVTVNGYDDIFPVWSPDGSKIAFECERWSDWDICTINPDGSGELNLTSSSYPDDRSPQWSPDGSKIMYTSGGDVYVMDADGSNQTNINDVNADAEYGIWSPEGSMIAFSKSVGFAHSDSS